jgi:hypothetical protein
MNPLSLVIPAMLMFVSLMCCISEYYVFAVIFAFGTVASILGLMLGLIETVNKQTNNTEGKI